MEKENGAKNDGRLFENIPPLTVLPGFASGLSIGIAISPVN